MALEHLYFEEDCEEYVATFPADLEVLYDWLQRFDHWL